MRKYLYKFFAPILFTFTLAVSPVPAYASEVDTIVDMVTLDDRELWDGMIPADLSWKTKQDKGQWIEELGLADGASSLILVVNSFDKEDPDALPTQADVEREEKQAAMTEQEKASAEKRALTQAVKKGQSRLMYLSKNSEDEWMEIMSVECKISGGELRENASIYGIYSPSQAFGNLQNPGSLLSYKELTGSEYWIMNPEHEQFGELYTVSSAGDMISGIVNLSAMKSFFNYAMVIDAQDEEKEYSSLMINCSQDSTHGDQFAGIQISESSLRMLIQCVDEATPIVIVGSVDELTELKNQKTEES